MDFLCSLLQPLTTSGPLQCDPEHAWVLDCFLKFIYKKGCTKGNFSKTRGPIRPESGAAPFYQQVIFFQGPYIHFHIRLNLLFLVLETKRVIKSFGAAINAQFFASSFQVSLLSSCEPMNRHHHHLMILFLSQTG